MTIIIFMEIVFGLTFCTWIAMYYVYDDDLFLRFQLDTAYNRLVAERDAKNENNGSVQPCVEVDPWLQIFSRK